VGQRGLGNGRDNFSLWKGNESRTGFFVQHRIISAVKRVKFVSDRMLYIVLRGRWRNIIVSNVHSPSEEKRMIQKTIFVRNYGKFSMIFLSTIWKFC
jgi:hypothetical protein